MVSSRLRTTIVFFAICGLMATAAFAGNLVSNPTNFAWEIAKPTVGFTAGTVVSIKDQSYTMGIGRLAGQSFVLTFTLDKGTFNAAPTLNTVNITNGPTTAAPLPDVTFTQRSGGIGSNTILFDVNVNKDIVYNASLPPTFVLGNIKYIFASGIASGYTVGLTVAAQDLYNLSFDSATLAGQSLSRTIATVLPAASFSTTASEANAVIDTTNSAVVPLTSFVGGTTAALVGPTPASDFWYAATANLTIATSNTTAGVMDSTGATVYTLGAGAVADKVSVVITPATGDFTNISSITMDAPAATATGAAIAVLAGSGSSATYTFTLPATFASLNGTHTIYFNKAVGTTLTPRSFNIAVSSVPAAGNAASLALTNGTAISGAWFTWTQNGTNIWAPYVNLTSANLTKFRFVNGGGSDITVQYTVKLDQAGATATTNATYPTLTVPANGTLQVTMNSTPDATQGEIGPLVTAITPATGQTAASVTRAKVSFIALGTTTNIAAQVLVWSPTGVITFYNMPQFPAWEH